MGDADHSVSKIGAYVRIGWVGAVLLSALVFLSFVSANRIGPRWFWATDACPSPNEICGVIPLSFAVAVFGSVVLVSAGIVVIHFAEHAAGGSLNDTSGGETP